ncbi:MAG: hypothetical protein L6Q99_08800 [Planctomycetes bacterium]|nr:hypothetical protein [Planctomycetota bacterium]
MRKLILTLSAFACSTATAVALDGGLPTPAGGPIDAPPVCVNNGPYVFEANFTPGSTTTDVQLTSAGSFDPDGDPLSFFWFEECPHGYFVDPTAADPIFTLDMAQKCTETCVIELRVTGGTQTSKCNTTITTIDTTPPVLHLPESVGVIWGDDATPLSTGLAIATDNCDPNPIVAFSDVVTPSLIRGLEATITRTWTATDYCGNTASAMVDILVYSPKQAALPNFDFDIDNCPNAIHRLLLHPAALTVLNSPKFNPAKIDWSTVEIQRRVPTTGSFQLGAATFALGQFGKLTATHPGECNSPLNDGKTDLHILVDEAALVYDLGLDADPFGTVVELAIRGRFTNGEYFFLRDVVETI